MNITKFFKGNEALIPQALTALWLTLKEEFKREDDIYKHSAMASETKYLNEAHHRRADAFMLIRRSVESASYSLDAAVKAAAVILGEIIHNYKKVPTAPMNEVTALVYNMVEDMRKPRYADAAALLSLTASVGVLEMTNNTFNDLYSERVRNTEMSDVAGTMDDIRLIIDKTFKSFTDGINAFYTTSHLEGTTDANNPYTAFIIYINGFVDQYEHTLARRTPTYSVPGDGSGDSDGSLTPSEPAGPPTLTVSLQEVTNNMTMEITLEDNPAFVAAMYPDAVGGTLVLSCEDPVDTYDRFPIVAFKMDDSTPVGFCVEPPDPKFRFSVPLYTIGDCVGEVFKDDVLLAVIPGLQWPASNG
jgi:hypothetical protein